MGRQRIVKGLNAHPYLWFAVLSVVGWLMHWWTKVVHWPHPAESAILIAAAGLAGLAIDVLLLLREKKAGEVD
jgi:hypothetical protein